MKDDIIIIVNEQNLFDENGVSLDKFNSTEVDVYINDELNSIKRISGTEFRCPENIGKKFKGYISGFGFVNISKNQQF